MLHASIPIEDCHHIIRHLEKSVLFSQVSHDTLQEFATHARLRNETKGKILFIQEDEAQWFYLIVQGWIKLFRETIDGTEAVIDVLNDGHLFGDTAVFENNRYSYSAEVAENTQLIVLPTSILQQEIKSNNQIALNMLSSMAQHRRQQSREIEHLNIQNAPQRIGCFLLRLCPSESPDAITIHLPYDKMLIASRLGMQPETFSRALSKLKAETGITLKGSAVTISDLSGLIDYTCNHCSISFPCEESKN